MKLTVLAAAAALAILPASASASVARAPVTPGSTYLALGDSVTFGYQEAQVVPAPNYHDAASFVAYPEQIARELHIKVVNPACPGETSGSLIDNHAESNGCENVLGHPGGYRTAFPLHVHYTGSQLAFAVHYLKTHRNVRLVSLMIGANDGFICQETTADHCGSGAEISALAAQITRNVRHILTAIRRSAHYRGQLVILNYFSLDYASPIDNLDSTFLNNTVDNAAERFGVQIADGFGEFQSQASKFGGHTCLAGLLTQWTTSIGPTCGVHPSYAGQALLAEAVLRAIRL
jgi:lysophospholipase L1-like esterase